VELVTAEDEGIVAGSAVVTSKVSVENPSILTNAPPAISEKLKVRIALSAPFLKNTGSSDIRSPQ
jgi:hypothetical protein